MKAKLNRRKFIQSGGLLTLGLWLSPKSIFAQEESPVTQIIRAAATAKVSVTKLRGNISVLQGSGGNVTVLDGTDGRLMVDAGIDVSKPNMLVALKTVGNSPLKHLINTHWHFDHVLGNLWLHELGAEIMAHENTLKNMSKTVRVNDWNYTFPPSPKGALPQKTFKKEEKMIFNGENIQMKHYNPAHTDSDISVHFPTADILCVGDTWWNGHYPFIDYDTGGSIKGMIKAADENIKNTNNDTLIVPGHGPIGNRNELIEYRNIMVDIYEKISAGKKRGKSLDEIIAVKPTSRYDSKWGNFVIDPDFFTRLVYQGV